MKTYYGQLNTTNIEYVRLLCNSRALFGTDDAMVINPKQRKQFHIWVQEQGGYQVAHPEGKDAGFEFLYSMYPLECWVVDGEKTITVLYQLGCHGIKRNTYVPLDKQVNEELWNSKVKKNDIFVMGEEVELIYEIVQGLFHYKDFSNELIHQINQKRDLLQMDRVQAMLGLIVFHFVKPLIGLIEEGRFEEIVTSYITFEEY